MKLRCQLPGSLQLGNTVRYRPDLYDTGEVPEESVHEGKALTVDVSALTPSLHLDHGCKGWRGCSHLVTMRQQHEDKIQ